MNVRAFVSVVCLLAAPALLWFPSVRDRVTIRETNAELEAIAQRLTGDLVAVQAEHPWEDLRDAVAPRDRRGELLGSLKLQLLRIMTKAEARELDRTEGERARSFMSLSPQEQLRRSMAGLRAGLTVTVLTRDDFKDRLAVIESFRSESVLFMQAALILAMIGCIAAVLAITARPAIYDADLSKISPRDAVAAYGGGWSLIAGSIAMVVNLLVTSSMATKVPVLIGGTLFGAALLMIAAWRVSEAAESMLDGKMPDRCRGTQQVAP